MSIFFELHKDIPREGPGSTEATRRAFERLNVPHRDLKILEIGCGPGMTALELAKWTDGAITALDRHEPFLAEVNRRAQAAGLTERIQTRVGNMFDLDLSQDQYDVIWSEGAIYIMGFANGLQTWRPFVKKGGYVVVSELSWLIDNPPEEAAAFWKDAYPGIRSVEQNSQTVEASGYRLLDTFVLPESGWWDEYYTPLEVRIEHLRSVYAEDAAALQVLDEQQQEIDLYRKYSDSYGYVFYVMQK